VADADLIIEVVPENLEIKKRVFVEIEKFAKIDHNGFENTSPIGINESHRLMYGP